MTMEPKPYQRQTLERVDEFLRLARLRGVSSAYRETARRVDADGLSENPRALSEYESLIEGLEDCPHVCVRIPTGGGKTLLAAHSIPLAARFMEREFPAVLWMVPSDTIRTQTAGILKDPRHPCRAFLDGAFGHQVAVYDIADFDAISAAAMFGKACVVVSTIQALRINETARRVGEVERARRRVYAHHEALDSHFAQLAPADLAHSGLERDGNGEVKRSFANLLHVIRPAVILDEAHNAVSPLSHRTLRRIRPSCILEFTATPRDEEENGQLLARKKHNILVSVPARRLREEEMIKLPVRLTEHKTWEESVDAAVAEQRRLEEIARESGDSIRPIVLYQAETDIQGHERTTWKALRKHLLEKLGEDGESQVKVETGDLRELADVDLLSADCEVRHVITVQALREGWDCPFAYVLCSVAERAGGAAVQQIMGRVLRMPFARERKAAELNLAYAHVRASNYAEAANALCEGMAGRMGYNEEELREQIQRGLPGLSEAEEDEEGALFGVTITAERKPDFAELAEEEREVVRESVEVRLRTDGKYSVSVREEIPAKAQKEIVRAVEAEKRDFEKGRLERFVRRLERTAAPSRRGVKFALLPQLQFKSAEDGEMRTADAEEFYCEAEWEKMGPECVLAEGEFRIEETGEVFTIYLSAEDKMRVRGEGQYRLPLTRRDEPDNARLARWLEREIRDPQGRYVPSALREFAGMNLSALEKRGFSPALLSRAKYQLAEALRRKLEAHGERMLKAAAERILFADSASLRVAFDFAFPPRGYQYNWAYRGAHEFGKHYYPVVGDLKSEGEEYLCAVALDSLDEVCHWVRNVPQKAHSFCIPLESGANFYPDFVAELEGGRILAVEYKGADRLDTQNAQAKKRAGEMMEAKGKGKFFFLMPSLENSGPSVRDQLRAKIEEIMKQKAA